MDAVCHQAIERQDINIGRLASSEFPYLITATPIANGIDDWKGYMPFVEHPDAEKW